MGCSATFNGDRVIMLSLFGLLFSMPLTQAVPFSPPPDNPTPPYSGSAGSRSGELCSDQMISEGRNQPQAYALIPPSQIGLTIVPNPTMMVYLQDHNPQQAIFSVRNTQRQSIYQTSIPVSGEAGVVAIVLPDEVVLDINQDYQWYFALECVDSLYPSTPISGWVRRIEPDSIMLTVYEQPPSIKQATELGTMGLWYDTLAVLHTIAPIDEFSSESIQHWKELLQSADLPPIF